jgi:hypothetical protein
MIVLFLMALAIGLAITSQWVGFWICIAILAILWLLASLD